MKLLNAHIKNFRLLKDLRLNFSTSLEKPLTVIRAANETGKTTCEYALMWGLYGSKSVLPKKGAYPLFPADLEGAGEKRVEVSVEIEFQVEEIRSVGRGKQQVESSRYRLIRSCIEYATKDDEVNRQSESVQMFAVKSNGCDPIPALEVTEIIESSLPEALKDVYFTDGDSAMSFIEAAATAGVKRKRVSNAVEALLGLEILNSTTNHLERVASVFSGEIDDTDYADELERVNDKISGWTEDIEEWEQERKEYEYQGDYALKELKGLRQNIEAALQLGDKSQLIEDKKLFEKQISRYSENRDQELKALSRLISSKAVSKIFIKEPALVAMDMLRNLNKDNQLPKVNIPILEELLDRDNCFCGEDLSEGSNDGQRRREAVKEAIESSRSSDAIQENASSLFYGVRSENFSNDSLWMDDYADKSSAYQNSITSLSEADNALKKLDKTIAGIDDSRLKELKEQEDLLKNKAASITTELGKRTAQIEDAVTRKAEAEEDRQKIERRLGKTNTSAGKLTLSRRVQAVFGQIVDKLKQEELRRVSQEMNRIFLEMIGSDPEANSRTLITRAELTDDFDIVVYGPSGTTINPDQGLNGASRRAITIAFILALTKVSEVEAPNVIDTPLGMTSGYVKQSILNQCLKEGTQIILFLTHDEIHGVENIIDDYVGTVFTLTNPAHYPVMLVNEPSEDDKGILRCECDHRHTCKQCERRYMEVA
jgi:DNA sulfur modification protein DndD